MPFRSLRKLGEDSDLYAAALRALMRRAYSVHEMTEYLGRHAADGCDVDVVVTRLRAQGDLDDAKYASDFARRHANARHQGPFRIARELRARGVSDQDIAAALHSVFAETDETTLVRARVRRKLDQLKSRHPRASEQRKMASLYRSLVAAGFSADLIRKEMREATKVDPGETAAESPDRD